MNQNPVSRSNKLDSPVPEAALASNTQASVISADMPIPLAKAVTVEDIIGWSIRGVSDDLIVDRIEHSNSCFHLCASQEIHLHDAGVSIEVIRAMKATAN